MSQRKVTIWNLLIIACVIILFGFLGGFVSGILNPDETAGIIIRTAGLFILISLGMKLFSCYYAKPLTQELREEETREAEEKDEKQMLFKPSVGFIIFFLFLILLGIYGVFTSLLSTDAFNGDVFGACMGALLLIGGLYLWYIVPVFTFSEDSVQITSHLFYLLGIDRKTVIRYPDITSVTPDVEVEDNMWGIEPRHRLLISTNGITQNYVLGWFNSDLVAKIYLRFKEKLGDKVTIP
jgi:hypothetical protein